MSPVAEDPGYVREQYEALRCEATELRPFGPRGHGLAVFLTRGLPGWLAALTALAPRPEPWRERDDAPRARGPTLLPTARAELTAVLAGMVLACTRDTEGR